MTELVNNLATTNLPLAYPETVNQALFRQLPEYFQVNERLNFKLDGKGDHLYLYIEKRNTNTAWLADELARKTALRPVDVGYAGRKDRFAVTRQWFSLHLPESRTLDLTLFQDSDYQLIEHSRHTHKLRKGKIACNVFKLQLTEFEGCFKIFRDRVSLLNKQGFPNYFGPQRFGHRGANIDKARNMLAGKLRVREHNKRSIYLSAARSYLFNLVLAKRIETGCWQSIISGDQFWDEQQHRLLDDAINCNVSQDLCNQGRFTITGPMTGDGESGITGDCFELEKAVLATDQSLREGIANSRIRWQRRPLKAFPDNLSCTENNLGVEIEFSLKSGVYATSLLRELLLLKQQI